jgi:protoporphyrinogen oxidase
MNCKKTVIVGSGLSALMMARMIKKYRDPDANIVILEREDQVGGQYGSINYGEQGYFDIGMHIIYETCIPEIDSLFEDLFPEKDWIILDNNYKDIAGIYVNGRLQTDTPYVDLRNSSPEKWREYVAEIFEVIRTSKDKQLPESPTSYDLLVHHFGKKITDEIFVPILEKLYFKHPSELAEIANKFTTINRLALFDSATMLDLMQAEAIRSRICYPDQLTMPPYRQNTQKGFYPREYGMFRVINQFRDKLEKEGVQFMTSTSISKLELDNHTIASVEVKDKNGTVSTLGVKELFWTAGLPGLAATLGIPVKDLVFEKKHTTDVYVNLLFDKKPEMGDLYYFYPFDKEFRSFRVTNYTNYCPSAAGERGFPMCVEFWARETDDKTPENLILLAQQELKAFGVIDDSYQLLFGKVESNMAGFPLPSVTNINTMNTINKRISDAGISNLTATGVLTDKNVFFIKDVLIDTYKKVTGKRLMNTLSNFRSAV